MKPPKKSARPTGKLSAPETTDAPTVSTKQPSVNPEEAETLVLLREAVQILSDTRDLQNEQLHVLRCLNSGSL